MKSVTIRTNKGRFDNDKVPTSGNEMTLEMYQTMIEKWDREDWVQLFSIISGADIDYIADSKDPGLESALYECIEFILSGELQKELDAGVIPDVIELRPLWSSDVPLIVERIRIKPLGAMSIGQKIQARKLLEDVKYIEEKMSMVTAIYLQPLIDKDKFDMLRVIQIEAVIAKMAVTKIYPLAFFLFSELRKTGRKRIKLWSLIKGWLRIKNGN